ncbi:succinoglycan biosynthesis protein ExoM [Rhodoligotrophos appendicifer]|uniref:glycosyltransferase n=1 Tax=Rhodoligotrophos appendicifer TaxID=987056 RepID=UPI001478EEA9|nr:glycosyltransferase family 2 protein [Rhodoligotrophos appendicifer]
MERLTIGIASCGRAMLAHTLASLCAMQRPDGVVIDILVADDDPGGAAARVVADAGPWSLPVQVVAVGAGNISAARNAVLDRATGDWIAFVDDDEWVAADWLIRMRAAAEDFAADVVVGPVFPQYPVQTPPWIAAADPLFIDWGPRGRRLDTGRSGNVLFRREPVQRAGLRFDPALGRSGGEDTDFFHRLHRAGAVMVATDDAHIFEEAPPARLDLGYMRRRSMRSGQSYARFRLGGGRRLDARQLAFYADAAAKMLLGGLGAALLRPLSRGRSLRWQQKTWLNIGKLRQITGRDLPSMY